MDNDNQRQATIPDIHIKETGIHFSDRGFKFSGGDTGDGQYRNFILFSDYADPDAIRVGSDYYAITSTFHLNPGISILHSKDLVNWQIIGHVVEDLSKLHCDFSFNSMRGYGQGIWAPSLRYNDGVFYIHVGGPKIGLIVCKAKSITGPWVVKRMKLNMPWTDGKLIDCCPLWDNDQAYFAAAEPRRHSFGNSSVTEYKMFLFKMSADGEQLLDNGILIHGGRTTEAVKMYKKNGYYYIFYVEHPMDENGRRTQFAARSRNIYGPYERKALIHSHGPKLDMCPCQGALIETEDGSWCFLCHGYSYESQAMAIGRPLMLLPVTWIDDWPLIGEDIDNDGIGEMVWQARKPVRVADSLSLQSSDEFEGEILGPQWQWNHAPRNDCWSLKEKVGYLRLKAAKPVYPGGFYHACNTLTQRLIGDKSVAATKLNVEGMADGQYAGLCLMADVSQLVGIYQENGKKVIRYQYAKEILFSDAGSNSKKYCDDYFCQDISEFDGDKIWLRLEHQQNTALLLFGLDGKSYQPAFDRLPFGFSAWRGGRTGFFNWNDFKEEGYADFEWFRYTFE